MAYAAGNIVDFVRGFGQRSKAAKIGEAQKNYLTNPTAAIAEVNKIDAPSAIALNDKYVADQTAATEMRQKAQKRSLDGFGQVTGYLRQARDRGVTNIAGQLDKLSPFLKQNLGASDDDIASWKGAITENPELLDALDTETLKAKAKLAGDVTVAGPGSVPYVGGVAQPQVPYADKVLAVPNEDGGRDVVRVPLSGGGGGAPGAGGGSNLNVDTLLPMFVEQESGGRYDAVNPETGASGKYQLMPDTARALAKQLGLPFRPDFLTSTSPAAQKYQDTLGRAAVQEAIDKSGGDPEAAFSYYYSGSPTAFKNERGNPRTAKYVREMSARLGGAPTTAPDGAETVYSTKGKSKDVVAATPEELAAAGYPEGAVAQKDANGKFVNLKLPSAATSKSTKLALQQATTARSTAENLDRLGQFADRLIKDKNLDSAVGNIYGRIPTGLLGQGAVDFVNQLDNLKKNIGLAALQQFKSLSATGASGFGNLSNAEGERLQAMFGVLERTASPALVKQTLKDIAQFVRDHNGPIKAGLADLEGGGAAPAVGTRAYNADRSRFVEWNGKSWVPGKGK